MINTKSIYDVITLSKSSGVEIDQARTDYAGHTHKSLAERLVSDYLKIQENTTSKEIYKEYSGLGFIVCNKSVLGKVKNLVVKGATDSNLLSSGVLEKGVIIAKTCGENIFNARDVFILPDKWSGVWINLKHKSMIDFVVGSQYYFNIGASIRFRLNGIIVLDIAQKENTRRFIPEYDSIELRVYVPEMSLVEMNNWIDNKSIISTSVYGDVKFVPYEENVLEIPLPNSMNTSGLKSINDNVRDLIREGHRGYIEIVEVIGVRAYQDGDELNINLRTDKVQTYYELDESVVHSTSISNIGMHLKTYENNFHMFSSNKTNCGLNFIAPTNVDNSSAKDPIIESKSSLDDLLLLEERLNKIIEEGFKKINDRIDCLEK